MRHNRTEKQLFLQSLGIKLVVAIFASTFHLWSDPWSQKSPKRVISEQFFLFIMFKNNPIQSLAVWVVARSVLSRKLEKPVGDAPKLRDITLPGIHTVQLGYKYKYKYLVNKMCTFCSVLYNQYLHCSKAPWHYFALHVHCVHCATRLYKACNDSLQCSELRNPKCYCQSILYRAGQRNACTRLGALEIPWHYIPNSLDRD